MEEDPLGIAPIYVCGGVMVNGECRTSGYALRQIQLMMGAPGLSSSSQDYLNSVMGGSGWSGSVLQNAQQKLSKICAALKESSKSLSANSDLPDYLTKNSNWNNISTLQGYANLYQSNLTGFTMGVPVGGWQQINSPIGQRISGATIGVAATYLFARVAGLKGVIAGAYAGTEGSMQFNNFVQNQIDSNQSNINAINVRILQLAAGC